VGLAVGTAVDRDLVAAAAGLEGVVVEREIPAALRADVVVRPERLEDPDALTTGDLQPVVAAVGQHLVGGDVGDERPRGWPLPDPSLDRDRRVVPVLEGEPVGGYLEQLRHGVRADRRRGVGVHPGFDGRREVGGEFPVGVGVDGAGLDEVLLRIDGVFALVLEPLYGLPLRVGVGGRVRVAGPDGRVVAGRPVDPVREVPPCEFGRPGHEVAPEVDERRRRNEGDEPERREHEADEDAREHGEQGVEDRTGETPVLPGVLRFAERLDGVANPT